MAEPPSASAVLENPRREVFAPGSLAERVAARSREALARGALLPIPTEAEWVHEPGGTFAVRVVARLADKDAARRRQAGLSDPTAGARMDAATAGARRPNPFLPYEEDLWVADVTETHVALLNKFNVLDGHLLLVTRRFVHQEALLDAADFEALARCLAEIDGLAFYNGGESAGASQPHKHLQLVPLPLAPGGPPIPLESAIVSDGVPSAPQPAGGLPFRNALVATPAGWLSNPVAAAGAMLGRYRALLDACGMKVQESQGRERTTPYNLLVTRRYMLLVPRSAECAGQVSLNALAFAGALLVRSPAQRDALLAGGCMNALRAVTLPR